MRFKSVIGAFFFVLLASFLAFIIFIQTKSFGNLVTKIVSDITQRKTQSKVRIKSLSLSIFPPGLELNKVSFKKEISDVEKIEAELGKVGFYVSLIEIEEKRLTLGEVRVSDSVVHYEFPKSNEELKEIDQDIINKVFDLTKRSPIGVNTLILENSRIFANHDLLEARRLKIFRKDDSFITRFHLANIKPSADVDFSLDEVWGDAELSRKELKIYRLKVQHDVQTVVAKGKIKNYRLLKNAEANVNGDGYIHLMSLKNIIEFPEEIQIDEGFAKVGFGITYANQKLNGKSNIVLEGIRSNIFYADEVQAGIELKDSKVILNSLELEYQKEKASIIQPVVIAEVDKGTYLTKPIQAKVEHVSLTNALRILPSLKVLHGDLTGQLSFQYKNGDLYFHPQDNFEVQNLALVVGEEKPFTVLKIKKAKLRGSDFSVINNEFHMNAAVEMAHSKLEVDGFVNKKELRFHVPESQVDLEDFGNISNLDIKGVGPLSVNVSGKLDDVIINLKGKTKGFEILGYRLGNADKNISIELKDGNVVINKMEAQLGKTHLSGTGLVNYDADEIAIGITTNDANYHDMTQILHPVLKDVDFLPEDLAFNAKVDVDIFGKYRLPELKIKSKIDFTDLLTYGESLNSGSLQVSLLNEVLAFKNFSADKGKGNIQGDFSFGLNDKMMKLKYAWENLDLSSFQAVKNSHVNINGKVSGTFAGSGTSKNYHFKLNSKIFDTKSQNYTFKDSDISLDLLSDRIAGDIDLLGNIFTADFNYFLKAGNRSRVEFNINAEDIKPIAVALFGQQLESESFSGKMKFGLDASFFKGFEGLDLIAAMNDLSFNHQEFKVNYSSKKPEFRVRNSAIEAWDLNIKESDLYLVTKGEGVFGKNVSLVHEFHINSKILEILLAPVMSADGFLRNIVRIDGKGTNYDFTVSSKTNELNMSIDSLPVAINNLKYNFEYANKRLLIQELVTSMDNGTVSLKGDIFFDGNDPDVNLKYQLDRAEIPILGKSSINLTGEGIVLGNQMPYNLGGEIVINKALIVNELNEFSSKSAALSQIRFLPKNQESAFSKLVILNVMVKADNPVRLTNSLMDVALKGEVRVFGNPARPRGEGRLFAPVNSSRIFFKNSEYMITNADINFSPKKDITNPDFDVQALTIISNYKVYPKAYGDLERFSFDLTSEPALPRNSILSLIAFGYSDEIQSTLRQDQQQNLTQVGVGSFVFDRFKISDILNKQFGLQVNLGTVFEQSTTDSLLAGRSQDGLSGQGGALGRTRSATKIELKKRLDEALTLSVSSTMGGGIGQRQSMNLNYGVTQKVQLEGVFELRTNAEGEEDVIDNSIGADVKFRWTFR